MSARIHTKESLQRAALLAFESACVIARDHGVEVVVVVMDATERVHYATTLGPTTTSGALMRCAGLYDVRPAPAAGAASSGYHVVAGGAGSTTASSRGGVAGSGASTVAYGHGGGVAGGGALPSEGPKPAHTVRVVSDPAHEWTP